MGKDLNINRPASECMSVLNTKNLDYNYIRQQNMEVFNCGGMKEIIYSVESQNTQRSIVKVEVSERMRGD